MNPGGKGASLLWVAQGICRPQSQSLVPAVVSHAFLGFQGPLGQMHQAKRATVSDVLQLVTESSSVLA